MMLHIIYVKIFCREKFLFQTLIRDKIQNHFFCFYFTTFTYKYSWLTVKYVSCLLRNCIDEWNAAAVTNKINESVICWSFLFKNIQSEYLLCLSLIRLLLLMFSGLKFNFNKQCYQHSNLKSDLNAYTRMKLLINLLATF